MKLYCPDCGKVVAAGDINLATLLAKCHACGAVFGFGQHFTGVARRPAESGPIVPRSKRMWVDEFGGMLRIRWRWFTPALFAMAFFCVFWDGFLVVWYTMALTHPPRGAMSWLPIVFPLLHVAAGVGITYGTLAGFFNRTLVEVGQGELRIKHYPLPWAGSRRLAAERITQLHCEQKVSRNKGVSYSYTLFATLTDGSKLALLSGFKDVSEPQLIEHLVEEKLLIEDRAVVGEYGRSR
jgi:hypothetical protein